MKAGHTNACKVVHCLLTLRKRMSSEFSRRRDGGAAFSAVLADVPSAAKR
jgi:hypothetical protein